MFCDNQPAIEFGEYASTETETTDSERWEQEPATSSRPKGALALVGAWREVSDEELDALIDDIYAGRQQDEGRRVELEL